MEKRKRINARLGGQRLGAEVKLVFQQRAHCLRIYPKMGTHAKMDSHARMGILAKMGFLRRWASNQGWASMQEWVSLQR